MWRNESAASSTPRAIFDGVENGAEGMYFHGGLDNVCGGYTPLCETAAGRYHAQPIYHGLPMTRLTGYGSVLPTTVSTTNSTSNLGVHTAKGTDGKNRMLLINFGWDTATTTVESRQHRLRVTLVSWLIW